MTEEQRERYGRALWSHELDSSEQSWEEASEWTRNLFRDRAAAVAEAARNDLIEELALEADKKAVVDFYYFGYDDVPGWIRSRKDTQHDDSTNVLISNGKRLEPGKTAL